MPSDQSTPGPWRTEYREASREEEDGETVQYYSQQILDAAGDLLATVAWTVHPDDKGKQSYSTNREANAILIASAPDLQAENEKLRAALTEALPALRMAYKGGHELTENDYLAYKAACELTDPPAFPPTSPAPPKDTP